MIPFDFEYYRPTTVEEATQIFHKLSKEGKKIVYFSGGTEFITFARVNKRTADAIIDIKGIPDCNVMEIQGEHIVIGAAVSLNKISESQLFPLLGEKVKQIADHTSRNKITIGGNLNSQLAYKEGILPLLLTNASVSIAGNDGVSAIPLKEVFQEKLGLDDGNFLVQIIINKEYIEAPYLCLKKTKSTKVGYPIVSTAALAKGGSIRLAISGVCKFPFRSLEMEDVLNNTSLSIEERLNKAISCVPATIIEDLQGAATYREFVLKNMLLDTMKGLEEYTL